MTSISDSCIIKSCSGMGSEQSSHPAQRQAQRAPPIRRGHTISATSRPEKSRNFETSASGNDSPGASVCSDSDLPYISYTVNRPIGDSPKHLARTNPVKVQKRQSSLQFHQKQRRLKDIIVVQQPRTDNECDLHIKRLQEIPQFLPILSAPLEGRDAHSGIDGRALSRAAARYQAHAQLASQPLATAQAAIIAGIKETDTVISRLLGKFTERQRANARNAERLSRVREISHQLSRCHSLLNQSLQDIEELNNLLPQDKKLKPFVWKT